MASWAVENSDSFLLWVKSALFVVLSARLRADLIGSTSHGTAQPHEVFARLLLSSPQQHVDPPPPLEKCRSGLLRLTPGHRACIVPPFETLMALVD